ncbi:MAG TPA: HNH endonuclease [Chryseosolibacter sp.]|nr:HNH endonuclease [Chryseosolibacter sp.]
MQWSGGETGQVLTGKPVGTYTAIVTDGAGRSASKTFGVGNPVEWTRITGMQRDEAYTLKKTAATAWNAGASSKNKLTANADGWIEFIASTVGSTYSLGLSYTDPNVNYTSILYGFYFTSNGLVSIYESGTQVKSCGSLIKGDVYRIERAASEIRYYKNGTLIHSRATDPTKDLYVDASMNTSGGVIPSVTGTFYRIAPTREQQVLGNLAFQYRYDARKRMIGKKLPGSDWVHMVYDNRDRVVLSQDGNQSIQNEWTFTKYDALNRPIMTGLYKHTGNEVTQAEMQLYVNTFTSSPDKFYEDYDGSPANYGYTNRSFPNTGTTVMTVTYYDDYTFRTLFNDPVFDFDIDHVAGQNPTHLQAVKGRPTGAMTRVVGENMMMRSVTYYDEKYRVLQTVAEDHQRKISRSTSTFDFPGRVLTSLNSVQVRHPILWQALVNVKYEPQKLTALSAGWNTGASSLQVLPASQGGWIETVLENVTDLKMFGFSDTDASAGLTIDYAAYMYNNQLFAHSNSSNLGFLCELRKGDVVRLERVAGKVSIIVNRANLYTFATTSTTTLIADCTFDTSGGTLARTTASFGTDPNTAPIRWSYRTNISVAANGVLTRTGASAWNAYAGTMNTMTGDGWIEFPASETNTARLAGLAATGAVTSYTEIDYYIYLKNNGQWEVRDKGAMPYTGTYASGDIFRIERVGSTVRFMKNGFSYHTGTISATTAYKTTVALHTSSATLGPLTMSFDIPYEMLKIDIANRLEYDHGGRLLKNWHQVNQAQEVLLASNEYNELGQLVTKKLHSVDDIEFQQHVDYRYNIRGWLTRMNNSDLDVDDGGPKDYFGMEFGYDNDLGIGTFTPQFNGNLSAVKWSANLGLGMTKWSEPRERAYKFSYDPMNRLRSASHVAKVTSWEETEAFREEAMYDMNGNILTMLRNNVSGAQLDKLVYDYGSGANRGNRVLAVTDYGHRIESFTDGNETGTDYAYDLNGNLSADKNKLIGKIKYNSYLNLTDEMVKENGEKVKSTYNADGFKIAELVYGASSPLPKKIEYVGPLVFEDDTLKFLVHSEGKVMIPKGQQEPPEYQYQIKDNVGNIRLTFTAKQEANTITATMEDTGIADETNPRVREMRDFENLFQTEIRNVSQWLNHTSQQIGNAIYLDGSDNKTIGPYTIRKVYPGDVIDMEVYGKYETKSDHDGISLASLLALLVPSVQTAAVNMLEVTPPDASTLLGGLNTLFTSDGDPTTAPQAYINYVLFDLDFNPVDLGFDRIEEAAGFEPASENTVDFDRMHIQRVIDRVGYIYVYVSNESPGSRVWMDDLAVHHKRSPIVQFEDYYPFGLSHGETAFERANDKYRGMSTTDGMGFKDLGFRQYDAALGRFHAVDPLAELSYDASTYHYAANNPSNRVDVLGLEDDDLIDLADEDERKKKKNKKKKKLKEEKPPKKDRKETKTTDQHAQERKASQTERRPRYDPNRPEPGDPRRPPKDQKETNRTPQNNAQNSWMEFQAQAFMNMMSWREQLYQRRLPEPSLSESQRSFFDPNTNRIRGFETAIVPPAFNDLNLLQTVSMANSIGHADRMEPEQYRQYLYGHHTVIDARILLLRQLIRRNDIHGSTQVRSYVSTLSNTGTTDDKVMETRAVEPYSVAPLLNAIRAANAGSGSMQFDMYKFKDVGQYVSYGEFEHGGKSHMVSLDYIKNGEMNTQFPDLSITDRFQIKLEFRDQNNGDVLVRIRVNSIEALKALIEEADLSPELVTEVITEALQKIRDEMAKDKPDKNILAGLINLLVTPDDPATEEVNERDVKNLEGLTVEEKAKILEIIAEGAEYLDGDEENAMISVIEGTKPEHIGALQEKLLNTIVNPEEPADDQKNLLWTVIEKFSDYNPYIQDNNYHRLINVFTSQFLAKIDDTPDPRPSNSRAEQINFDGWTGRYKTTGPDTREVYSMELKPDGKLTLTVREERFSPGIEGPGLWWPTNKPQRTITYDNPLEDAVYVDPAPGSNLYNATGGQPAILPAINLAFDVDEAVNEESKYNVKTGVNVGSLLVGGYFLVGTRGVVFFLGLVEVGATSLNIALDTYETTLLGPPHNVDPQVIKNMRTIITVVELGAGGINLIKGMSTAVLDDFATKSDNILDYAAANPAKFDNLSGTEKLRYLQSLDGAKQLANSATGVRTTSDVIGSLSDRFKNFATQMHDSKLCYTTRTGDGLIIFARRGDDAVEVARISTTGGTQTLEFAPEILTKIDPSDVGKLTDDVVAQPELLKAIGDNPELASAWKKLLRSGNATSEVLRKDTKTLEWIAKQGDNIPPKAVDDLLTNLNGKTIERTFEDAQGRLVTVTQSTSSVRTVVTVEKTVTGEIKSFKYTNGYNQAGQAGKPPVSENGLAPDFSNKPASLYPTVGNEKNIVKIKLSGKRQGDDGDFHRANQAANLPGTTAPTNYTWHHLDDFDPETGEATMQLVKTTDHVGTTPHTGSVKQYENYKGTTYSN